MYTVGYPHVYYVLNAYATFCEGICLASHSLWCGCCITSIGHPLIFC